MLENFIRNTFIYLTSIYAFYKLLNRKPQDIWTHFILLSSSLIASLCSGILFGEDQNLNWIFNFFLFLLIIFIAEKQFTLVNYTAATFSYTLGFITFCVSIVVFLVISILFYFGNYKIPWLLIQFLIGLFQFFLISYCFRIPRLRIGMTFLYHMPSGNITSTLCIIIILLMLLFSRANTMTNSIILLFYAFALVFSFILIYWWNYHITQTYRNYLRKNELDSLNLLLEEQNQEIAYLKSENDKLARIIHKDNKIIPALSMAILDAKNDPSHLQLPKDETQTSLYQKLQKLYEERTETLENYQKEGCRLPQSAYDSVNAVLNYMQAEAARFKIPYQVILFDDLSAAVPKDISEEDLTHLLSDLLSNAIYASKEVPTASIQVCLGEQNGIFTVRVHNTGSVFPTDVLRDLGLVRHTTHADTGGSGIGLMDIWSIKKRCSATLLIDELSASPASYTSINLLWNRKDHYMIQSDRSRELSTCIRRSDLMLLSKSPK